MVNNNPLVQKQDALVIMGALLKSQVKFNCNYDYDIRARTMPAWHLKTG